MVFPWKIMTFWPAAPQRIFHDSKLVSSLSNVILRKRRTSIFRVHLYVDFYGRSSWTCINICKKTCHVFNISYIGSTLTCSIWAYNFPILAYSPRYGYFVQDLTENRPRYIYFYIHYRGKIGIESRGNLMKPAAASSRFPSRFWWW